jgi:hypothetical protein
VDGARLAERSPSREGAGTLPGFLTVGCPLPKCGQVSVNLACEQSRCVSK